MGRGGEGIGGEEREGRGGGEGRGDTPWVFVPCGQRSSMGMDFVS